MMMIFPDGTFWGLGVDWITGNIYAVTHNGFIIACNNAKEIGSFACVPVLSGLGTVKGIALNPAETCLEILYEFQYRF